MMESIEWIRIRPPAEDDSLTVPLYMRHQGSNLTSETAILLQCLTPFLSLPCKEA